jgi:hypothetical protein
MHIYLESTVWTVKYYRHIFYSLDIDLKATKIDGGVTSQHLAKPLFTFILHEEELRNFLTIYRIHWNIPSKRQVPEKDTATCCMFKGITIGICKTKSKPCKAPPPIYRQRRIVCMIEGAQHESQIKSISSKDLALLKRPIHIRSIIVSYSAQWLTPHSTQIAASGFS